MLCGCAGWPAGGRGHQAGRGRRHPPGAHLCAQSQARGAAGGAETERQRAGGQASRGRRADPHRRAAMEQGAGGEGGDREAAAAAVPEKLAACEPAAPVAAAGLVKALGAGALPLTKL